MTRFRVVFILLLALAMSTSVLAISGLVGSWEESGAYFGTSAASSTATTTVTASSSATVLSISASTTSASSIATTTNTVSSTVAQQGTSSSRNTVNDSLHAAYGASLSSLSSSANGSEVLVVTAQRSSLFLAPACWIAVLGAWIWRGKVRARWKEVGFSSDVFELFMKMRGGATRIRLLNALEVPKDRLQAAQQLGLDWKAVDRHMQVLNKYGFVREQGTYGTARVYEVTPLGKMLLKLYDELDEADKARIVDREI